MKSREITYVVEFSAMFLVWLTVAVTYHVMSVGKWRNTPEGRHVMGLAAIFIWLAALILTNLLFREYPARWLVGTVSYGLPTVYGIWRLAMIVHVQRIKRRQAEAATEASRSAQTA